MQLGALQNHWDFDPRIVCSLLFALATYFLGVLNWIGGRCNRHAPLGRITAFLFGWITLVAALLSPLHGLSESLFSAHMVQHELLMAVAAPLLIMGRPEFFCIWALPWEWRKHFGKLQRSVPIKPVWRIFASPFLAWCLHALALWLWHIPSLFNATIAHDWVHVLQHASFLGTALLFWGTLLYGHLGRRSYGKGILYVFTTAVHTSILGALLTFASSPWYRIYRFTTSPWGLSPLEDQQLGGLIMWVPAGLVYIFVGLWLFAEWIKESDQRSSFRNPTLGKQVEASAHAAL
jgi:cytochrome c oxidase assembly factor CtaG